MCLFSVFCFLSSKACRQRSSHPVVQLAEEQAQSMAASEAAEEHIEALEQRLASHAQASSVQQTAAGDPPAMAAPGQSYVCVFHTGTFNGAHKAGSYHLLRWAGQQTVAAVHEPPGF